MTRNIRSLWNVVKPYIDADRVQVEFLLSNFIISMVINFNLGPFIQSNLIHICFYILLILLYSKDNDPTRYISYFPVFWKISFLISCKSIYPVAMIEIFCNQGLEYSLGRSWNVFKGLMQFIMETLIYRTPFFATLKLKRPNLPKFFCF